MLRTVLMKKIPIGHELNLLKELRSVFAGKAEVLAGKEYIQSLNGDGTILPYCISPGICKAASLKILCNYFISLLVARGDVLVYVDTSEALLWGIALFKGKKKIVSITYLEWEKYRGKYIPDTPVRQFLIRRGLKRLDGCMVSNNIYKPKAPYIRIPDYFITDEIRQYQNRKKISGCVCLGEIRGGKDVEGLVRVMRRTSVSLLIAGSFRDKNTYRKVKRIQTENIIIKDKNLPYETYMEYLSTYKYVVLPYDINYYSFRTSGVLLEGIFLGAVPIAPKSLLEKEQIQGLGYRNLSEIPELIRLYECGEITVQNDLGRYQFEEYKAKIVEFINRVRRCM